ncbi:MAG: Smr/MutS family protein [Xanthobacteraceae bacterium]|uniref:Smr/MutS family protein n=1 Tax=Pseudolabrys sp. TaxID=1960880 RepID=UPI003D13B5CE
MSGKGRDPDHKSGRRRILTREERVIWTTFTKAIMPLPKRAALDEAPDDAQDVPPPAAKTSRQRAAASQAPPARAGSSAAPPLPPSLAPLDRRAKRRVASGRDAIDARFDLHGLTQSEAHTELLHFLRSATARDARLVLVITGKSGVLRRQVPQWLALPEFRALTIGFETAHVRHGGDGALYVRLRRAR